MKHTILKKSFREIENKEWEDEIPSQNDSYVFRKAYELYHKKLEDFTDEDLRFIIGQNHYLEYTIPLAIGILKNNPFAEGDFYPGSLLENVLKADSNYWKSHPNERKEVEDIFLKNVSELEMLGVTDEIKWDIKNAYEDFFNN
jgi:hypothetical protein